jgi:enoyl-CoA hydratase/carnithine racemase
MIDYSVSGGRATITINDPERRNPLSVEAMGDLLEATQLATDDEAVNVIVYTGAGDLAFSAGGDLSSSFASDPTGQHEARAALGDLFRLMTRCGKPTIARVNGHALAGGFGLAVACDITICVDDCKLGLTEIKVGLWPMVISAVLVRTMSPKAVLDLAMTGRIITPQEAQTLGAVSRVVPRDQLDSTVDSVVADLLSSSGSTLKIGKDAFYGILDADFDSALDRLHVAFTELASSDDAQEGVRAFLEKRDPDYS